MNVREETFRTLLEKNPDLCAGGLATAEFRLKRVVDFPSERSRLEASFPQFQFCCEWLLDCTPLKHVSFVSPVSTDLLPHLEKEFQTAVSNGVLIAAVLYMKIPHRPLPESFDVRIGISLRSPALQALAFDQKARPRAARP